VAKDVGLGVALGLDRTEFESGLVAASKSAKRWQKRTTGGINRMGREMRRVGRAAGWAFAGASAGAVAFGVAMKKAAAELDDIGKAAKRAGVSAEALQAWEFGATEAGVKVEQFRKSLEFLTRAAGNADQGMASYLRQFELLGVSVRDRNGRMKTTEQLFRDVAAGLQTLDSHAQRATASYYLFGRSGLGVNVMLREGAASLEAIEKKAGRFGLVLDNETVAGAERAIDAFELLGKVLKTRVLDYAGRLLPVMTDLAKAAAGIAGGAAVTETFRDQGKLREAVASKITGGTAAAARVVRGMSNAFAGLVETIGLVGLAIREAFKWISGNNLGAIREDIAETRTELENLQRIRDRKRGITRDRYDLLIAEKEAALATLQAREQEAQALAGSARTLLEIRAEGEAIRASGEAWAATLERRGAAMGAAARSGGNVAEHIDEITVKARSAAEALAALERKSFGKSLEEFKVRARSGQEVLDEIIARSQQRQRQMQYRLQYGLASAIQAGAEEGGRGMVRSLLGQLRNNFINQASGLLARLFTGGGGGGGFLGKIFGGLFGAQHGFEGTIGGPGGTDKALVAFWGTRGEQVKVTPRGESGGSAGADVVVHQEIHQVIQSGPGISPQEAADEVVDRSVVAVQERFRRGFA